MTFEGQRSERDLAQEVFGLGDEGMPEGPDWPSHMEAADAEDLGFTVPWMQQRFQAWTDGVANPEGAPPELRLRWGYRRLMAALAQQEGHAFEGAVRQDPSLLSPLGLDLADPFQAHWVVHPAALRAYGGLTDLLLKLVHPGEFEEVKRRGRDERGALPLRPWEGLFHWQRGRFWSVDLRAVRPLPYPSAVMDTIDRTARTQTLIGGRGTSSQREKSIPIQVSRVSPSMELVYPARLPWGALSIQFDSSFGPVVQQHLRRAKWEK